MSLNSSSTTTTVWVGPQAVDMVPFDQIVPIDAIVTCDYGSDVKELEATKVVFSLERLAGIKHAWSNFHVAHLFQDDIQRSLLGYLANVQGTIQFFCYCSSGLLDQMISIYKLPAKNLSIPIQQKLYYDDKILLHYTLKWLGIETLPTETEQLGNLRYTSLKERIGEVLVIKLPWGSAGGRVYYVDNQESLDQIQRQFRSATALVQQFRPGIPLNVQGIIFSDDILIAPASIQIIGPEECSRSRFEWCGNDFHVEDYAPDDLVNKAVQLTKSIGQTMKVQGYQGIFGVDLLLDVLNGKVYLLEINPRQQGSTSLLTQLELLNNATSFFIERHFAAFGGQFTTENLSRPILTSLPIIASQVVLYYKGDEPSYVEQTIKSGIYSLTEDDTLLWIRRGLTLLDCKSATEFVISGGTPLEKQVIMPGASLLHVQSFKRALDDPVSGKLTKEMATICRSIYRQLRLSERR